MPRQARKKSESGYYHIVHRGIGRQILFEDEEDNARLLSTLQRYRRELGFDLVAYCLMENHIHLLIHDANDQIDLIMKKLAGSYAYYYNQKYERSGHVFQDRYCSEPVENDAYLLTVMRYIHNNPEKAGIAKTKDYRWSSYAAYQRPQGQIDNGYVLEMIGGPERFEAFMRGGRDEKCLDISEKRGIRDDDARAMIAAVCSSASGTKLQQWDRTSRDAALHALKAKGLTVRQLERLTGINRGVIQKA